MKTFRKYLILFMAALMFLSSAMPAWALDEEPLTDIPEDSALSEDGSTEPSGETESVPDAAEVPTPTPEPTPELPAEESPAPEPDAPEAEPEITPEPEAEMPAEEPAPEEENEPVWHNPGNSDLNILAGGIMLNGSDCLYFCDNGIWQEYDGGSRLLVEDASAGNLNLGDDWLYYTSAYEGVKRYSLTSGLSETVLNYSGGIDQLYLIGRELRFLSAGEVYSYNMDSGELRTLESPDDVRGLIPTQYGNIFLTGAAFDRTVWVGTDAVLYGVESCYTDGDRLVVNRDGTWEIALSDLFGGGSALEEYSASGPAVRSSLSDEQQLSLEADYFQSEEYLALQEILTPASDGAADSRASKVYSTALGNASASSNEYKIALRARQMADVLWTPLKDRYAWGGSGNTRTITATDGSSSTYFKAGKTYQGIPYSQAVYTGFVGWDLSISDFLSAVNKSSGKFYTSYSTYSKTAPYYGNDCSAFVSWAWDVPVRCTCTSLVTYGYCTYIGTNYNAIKLGDCLNNTSAHVTLVTDIGYDANGNIISIEITEQTPCKMRVTIYGEPIPGKRYDTKASLTALQKNYLEKGYVIYRRKYSGKVSYTPNPDVPVAEDGWIGAPTITYASSADGSAIEVTITHSSGNDIYYTLDGSKPTTSSTKYTGPIRLTSSKTVRAIVDPGTEYSGSYVRDCSITVDKADAPLLSLVSGALSGTKVQRDSYVSLFSEGAETIYYTTDGSEPTLQSAVMPPEGIKISEEITIKAFAMGGSTIRSDIVTYALSFGSFHKITVDTGMTGGVIYPEGVVDVIDGEDYGFQIEPLLGYKIKKVLVDGVDVGPVSLYIFEDVSADHTISAVFEANLPFTDVKSTNWFVNDVAFAYTNNLFKGVSDTEFAPYDSMTRGMFVTVLGRFDKATYLENFKNTLAYTNGTNINVRASASTSASLVTTIYDYGTPVAVTGTTEGTDGALWYKISYNSKTGYIRSTASGSTKPLLVVYDGQFNDLSKSYYYGYVQWAYMHDIINGRSTTVFDPNSSISRQDICVVLYNYLTNCRGLELDDTAVKTFSDQSQISSYALQAVHAMANIGVISGYAEDGSFRPHEAATRAEVSKMFRCLYEYLYEE